MKQCNSVRPAFVLEAHREDVVTELMYVYIPMGLERQHDVQSSVLARFCSHELASCYLAVASESLDVGFLSEACTCSIPEASRKNGGPSEVMRKWYALIETHRLQRCYALGPETVLETETQSWQNVRKMIRRMAPTDYEEALNVIETVMHTIG